MRTFDVSNSSNVVRCRYDEDKMELRVTFKDGYVYAYEGFPPPMWEALIWARSVGGFIHKEVKNIYPSRRLERDEDV